MGNPLTSITNLDWKGMGSNLILGVLMMIFFAFIAIVIFMWIKNKKTYTNPVAILELRSNGTHKEYRGFRGGLIQLHSGVTDFQIKAGMKKRNLGYIPDFSLADANDELTFLKSGDGKVLQQVRKCLIKEKDLEVEVDIGEGKTEKRKINYSLIVEPIPTDIKTVTINNIHSVDMIMDKNKLTAMKISIGAFILMVFCQILFLFLTSK
jgi:hypothetical protein